MTTLPESRWFTRALRRYGRAVASRVATVLRKLGRAVLAGLDEVAVDALVAEIVRRMSGWGQLLRDAAFGVLLAGASAAAVDQLRRFVRPTVELLRRVRIRVRAVVDQIAAGIGRAVDTVRKVVVNAVRRAGRTGADPIAAVAKVFKPEAVTSRANRIAEIETLSTINGGKAAAAVDLYRDGYITAKVWRSRRDNRVRDTHRTADGQAVPMYADFTVGGYRCQYPGDPSLPMAERAGCRCECLYRRLRPDELAQRFRGTVGVA